jgi:flagellar protein FlaI
LLRAALRHRPNEIIIGEIRGEEGAIAFQAMQTGHTCMSTFHASSIEKLIQRLTGSPINIPKTYIDNLQLAIIISSVRLADGSTARRVVSINEILGYNSEVDSFEFVEVFRWSPSTDRFEFPARSNSRLLEEVVAVRRGLSGQDARRIYDEIDDRATIFKRLHERGVTNFYELFKILSQAHREGLFR